MRILYLAVILICLSPAAHSQTACLREFTEFITQFENSPEFQRKNTRFPLSTVRTDRVMGTEAKTVFLAINSPADPKYPEVAFPSPAAQAAAPLKQRIKKGSGARFVQFTRPGTGGTFTFTFEMSAGCWQLIKFEEVLR